MSILSLSTELIDRIGSTIYLQPDKYPTEGSLLSGYGSLADHDDEQKAEFSNLISLATTCRRLRGILSRHLFSHVRVRNWDQARSLVAAPWIEQVRTLKIVLEDVDSVRDHALVRDRSLLGAYSLFRSIFCKVSNVQHLSVITKAPHACLVLEALAHVAYEDFDLGTWGNRALGNTYGSNDELWAWNGKLPFIRRVPADTFVSRLKSLHLGARRCFSYRNPWEFIIPTLQETASLKRLILDVDNPATKGRNVHNAVSEVAHQLDTLVIDQDLGVPLPTALVIIGSHQKSLQTLVLATSTLDMFFTRQTLLARSPGSTIAGLPRLQVLKFNQVKLEDEDNSDSDSDMDFNPFLAVAYFEPVLGHIALKWMTLLAVQVDDFQWGIWRSEKVDKKDAGEAQEGDTEMEETGGGAEEDGDGDGKNAEEVIKHDQIQILPLQPGDLTAILAGPPNSHAVG